MKYEFDPNLPIYLQVMEEMKKSILKKEYLPGHKIPSVRELALEYSINPNTIQKALSELEREGLLTSVRAVGKFVVEDLNVIENLRKEKAHQAVLNYYEQMSELGYDQEGMIQMIKQFKEE